MRYAISTFVISFLLLASGLLLLFYRELLGQRLASILGRTEGETRIPVISRLRQAAESLGLLAGSIQKIVPKSGKELSIVR
jgi:tight adherence protein C